MLKARTRKIAPLLCAAASLLALLGIVLGLALDRPLWIVVLLLPTAVYEVIRTEGRSTKAASAVLLIVLLALAALLIFDISFDLAAFFGAGTQYVAGYRLPLADVKLVAPALMAILSIILFLRTWGVYTRWLAATIFITSFAIIYALDPEAFQSLLRLAIEEGVRFIR